eukprot:CAMPEP_0202962490 /NCGR_PEP_ID=MMETSP1396-20130829/6600_1 /ASSEMBLY_ACC=CAM_ASM_000872 /TAXON_ID= /ORGANISM="Pseudokeronopsis sp., Strain Brazil" /LENGTH=65 /DNA_ID=CAMNT_0049683121 /DNA_START=112 /DNA_END=309 /DNA_ORIENTATION=+
MFFILGLPSKGSNAGLLRKKSDQKLRKQKRKNESIGTGAGSSATSEDVVARLLQVKFIIPKIVDL